MAKGRMINKRIAKSDKLAALTKDRHRVIYFMIYPHVDRDGRYSADPLDIKEDCCPRLRYTVKEILESLIALDKVGLIALYKVNEKRYLEVFRFDDFQVGLHKEREAPSEIPPNPGLYPDNSGSCRTDVDKIPLNLKSKFNLKSNKKSRFTYEPGHLDLAKFLSDRIKENVPHHKFKPSDLESWANEFRLMEERDEVGFDLIKRVLAWATNDEFWKINILSGGTFREKFGRLEAKMKQDRGTGYQDKMVGSRPALTDQERIYEAEMQAELKALGEKVWDKDYSPRIRAAASSGKTKEAEDLRAEGDRKFEKEGADILRKYAIKKGRLKETKI